MLITRAMAAMRRVVLAVPLVLLASLHVPAQAQSAPQWDTWKNNGCNGCHSVPPTVTNIVADASSSFTLGLGETWMSTSSVADVTPLVNRVHAAGTFYGAGAEAMQNLNATDGLAVYRYFKQLRDGEATAGSASLASKVGVATSASFTFSLGNYRKVATAYTLSLGGAAPSDYTITGHTATGTNCSTGTLPAADNVTGVTSCTINLTVSFTPGGAGSRNATVLATLASPGVAITGATLSGTGQTPAFSITPASRSVEAKRNTTVSTTYTITNGGDAVLDLTGIALPSPRFAFGAANTCATAGTANVAANNGTCTLAIDFTPIDTTTSSGQITITHDASGGSNTVDITGIGTQATMSVSSPTVAMGNSQVGVPKVAGTPVTVSNTAANTSATLVFTVDPPSAAALSGTNKDDFSVQSTCSTGSPLAAGASCAVTVIFTPGGTGPRVAQLVLSSDATNPAVAIDLSGTGVALPEPVVTFPTLAFPDTVIGETGAQTRQVTISNDRTRDITYTVADATDFKIDAESCATRTVPGDAGGGPGSCTITWRFQPVFGSGEGNRQATIAISFAGTSGDPAPSDASGQLSGRALLPISLSATTVNAAAVVGTPTTSSVVLTNRSAGAVTISALAFSGAQASDYSLVAGAGNCSAGGVLAAGANCTLVIRFDPPAAGTRSALLTVSHGAPGGPQTVTITGTATPAPQGRIELSALALNFPDTELGGSSTRSVTVRNGGNLALNFSAFTLAGANSADFQRAGTCSTATPLAINAQCTISVSFAPAALGARSASLTIQSDASNGPATISLAGTGVPVPAPLVSLTPASIDFGTQTVGGLYPGRTVRLANTGTADLAVSAIAVQGAAFTANATACPGTLAPGDGCDIVVGFAPTSAGTDLTATLRVTSNAAGSPHGVALRGRGSLAAVPVLVWSPAVTTLDFGDVSTGTVSAVQSATLLNQGPGGVTLTLLNAVGPGAASFSVAGGTCQAGQTLFEGQSCRVDVSFAPAAAGARTATVQVASGGSAPPELTLRGTGLGGPTPTLALSLSTLVFDATRVGDESLPGELTLRSTGSGALRITGLVVSGPFKVAPKSCPGVPFTLPAGAECTVSVSFLPDGEGTMAGTLRVNADADPSSVEVALSGRGEARADVSSGGGCSIARGDTLVDPTLWTLVLLAAAVLLARRRARRGR